MSQNHYNDFLQDIKTINPGFRRSTSSLKGLISHLESTVAAPVPMSTQQALGHCSSFRNSRLDKYRPAIGRLTSVWGKGGITPYPKGTYGGKLVATDINRLCFRGDDRSPEEIFPSGFSKRAPGTTVRYKGYKDVGGRGKVFGPMAGMTRPGDIDAKTAVCITPDMNIAALFPLPTTGEITAKETWVYLVFIERGYNTHGRQILDAIKGLGQLMELENEGEDDEAKADIHRQRGEDLMKLIYGRELAADSLRSDQVIGAFRIRRGWKKKTKGVVLRTDKVGDRLVNVYGPPAADFKEGGRYQVLEWQENPNARFPDPSYRAVVDEFVAGLTDPDGSVGTLPLPTAADGFVPSFKRHA